jgi:hypothetical protein
MGQLGSEPTIAKRNRGPPPRVTVTLAKNQGTQDNPSMSFEAPKRFDPDEYDKIAAEISSLWTELHSEIALLAKVEHGEPDAPATFPDPIGLNNVERRLLIRSIFSCIDALTYSLKQLALNANDAFKLDLGERMLATEETYELSSSGHIATRRAKLQTLANVRFAFDLLAKVDEHDFRLDVSQHGWQLLQNSLKVRDRLTHPKKLIDLEVSDEEIRAALRAFSWFESQVVLALLTSLASTRKRSQEIKAVVTAVEREGR